MNTLPYILAALVITMACQSSEKSTATSHPDTLQTARPLLVSAPVKHDSDDPAIWINKTDPAQSLVLGTDKGGDAGDGAIYVFDLQGKEIKDKTVRNIRRPNNVDIAYGLMIDNHKTDIAVCTERNANAIRVFSLPDMKAVDAGGIPVFENDTARAPMGVALFTDTANNIYAIVSRKNGNSGEYLWQYRLEGKPNGTVTAKLVRKFGRYSGKHEIESVAVDNELAFVYYSDEGAGIRKYYAHPDSTNEELAFFGTTGFADNHEGISIYKNNDGTGYIIVSDQQANRFQVFTREGSGGNPHQHALVKVINTSTIESDGSDVTSTALPGYPHGLFVAMSDDKTFQFYSWTTLWDHGK